MKTKAVRPTANHLCKNGMWVITLSGLRANDKDDAAYALDCAIVALKAEVKSLMDKHPDLDICVARENAADFPEDTREFWSCICHEFLARLDDPESYK